MNGMLFNALRPILSALLRLMSYPLRGITYFWLNYLTRYRKEIIESNLLRAFPEASSTHRREIKTRFYWHFAAFLIETLELLVISKSQLLKRIIISEDSLQALRHQRQQNKSVIILAGHNFNWEYCSIFPTLLDHRVLVSYKTLRSSFWDKIIRRMRSRFGATLVDHRRIYLSLHRFKRAGEATLTWLGGDQMPHWKKDNLVVENFLGSPTYFINGLNEIAVKTEAVVYFQNIRKTGRSSYHVELQLITETPQNETAQFITSEYARLLEQLIREQPANWLWSHKRWKKTPDTQGS